MGVRERLLDRTPETLETFELRTLLLDPATEIHGDATGATVKSASSQLVVVVGDPDPTMLPRALADTDRRWMVIADAPRPEIAPGWTWQRGTTLVHDDPAALSKAAGASAEIRAMTRQEIIRWLTPETSSYALEAHDRGPVVGAWAASGALVSMAYSLLSSERFYHPTIVAFRAFRGRGFGRRVFRTGARLIELQARAGRSPVPTVLDSNRVVLEGCLRLGFRAVRHRWQAYPVAA
ncbi:MAG: hypothetical protein IT384_19275 [Deltaproteobacteria bacterium]|nr:hypothetical protein [Deltaproteobacteria bacterium]